MSEHKTELAPIKDDAEQSVFPGVSVVIPAYNEQEGIRKVLDQLALLFTERGWPHEIIVVDDGSDDNTSLVAESFSGVRVFRHPRNRGYGAALKTGIRHARYGFILITDADGTYPNERIPDLVAKILENTCDMVVGARVGSNVSIPSLRKPAKWFIRKLAELVASTPIPDLNSGLRIFKRAASITFFNMIPEGFSFTTTITLAMITNGYIIEYLPIEYYPRVGKSKIRPIRDTLNFIQLVLRIALYFAPLKIFIPISAVLIFTAMGWAAFSALVLGRLADASTAVIFMTGVQVGVLGLLAELLDRRLPSFHRPDDHLP